MRVLLAEQAAAQAHHRAARDVIDMDVNGVVSVNGVALDEPYVDALTVGECDIRFPYQVPENRYFVLGDHRATSIDSRSSVIGCVEKARSWAGFF